MTLQAITPTGQSPETWLPVLHSTATLTLDDLDLSGKVLVVSAHADDETLGAGGLLSALADAGAQVCCIICTDGAAAFPDATDLQRYSLATQRRAEARYALDQLGLQKCELIFLNFPDGCAQDYEPKIEQAIMPLSENASLIIAPWRSDPHRDHRAAGRAASSVAGAGKLQLLEYPVWMRHSMQPTEVDFDGWQCRVFALDAGQQERKNLAINAYSSQVNPWLPQCEPVLPDHVIALFQDKCEPFFVNQVPHDY